MHKYLEYDIQSGQIISELICENKPLPSNGFAMLEIDVHLNIDTSSYAVREGQLVKLFETNAERAERERLQKEYHEQIRSRLRTMVHEFIIAMLDDNDDEIQNLKNEFKQLKVYL